MKDAITVAVAGRRDAFVVHDGYARLDGVLVHVGDVICLVDEPCPICVLVERDGRLVPMPIDLPQRPESPIHVRVSRRAARGQRDLVLVGDDVPADDADPVAEAILRRIAKPEDDEGEIVYVTGLDAARG